MPTSYQLNQRTDGPVNAHLILAPDIGTKHTKSGQVAKFDPALKSVNVNPMSLFERTMMSRCPHATYPQGVGALTGQLCTDTRLKTMRKGGGGGVRAGQCAALSSFRV